MMDFEVRGKNLVGARQKYENSMLTPMNNLSL
jgi:hypothetical protein